MSDLFIELTAPNGRKYKQPRGLFINNEFVKSKSGETISSINPRCDIHAVVLKIPSHVMQ
jgi:aldehyde dehydrogenase (NAD+)